MALRRITSKSRKSEGMNYFDRCNSFRERGGAIFVSRSFENCSEVVLPDLSVSCSGVKVSVVGRDGVDRINVRSGQEQTLSNFFSPSLLMRQNKLECLSLPCFSAKSDIGE